ncbi:unnamed protein product [Aphanomyces euteiches]|uniref:RING-type domain-containing protein n=1 Tax=Aphanomyces euteiches TaxID=100861 RepID=A0A6G0WHI3_9STRA|nr:hypothetical protein Ae201684_015254 [Aphanomyces euteiches]KAH9080011.1 hypothetical protein Ae201684P_020590 [Aphanomyces euteiches]KAH9120093.1 hypothetical protein LEN26_011295 [Aphanomyces euteiches]KAH9152461.1 hypothetical protein AeRB84_005113 [Aphanomyces euteiches]
MSSAKNPVPAASPVDTVPLISQAKSIFQALVGDVKGAAQTQDNFTKGCPVVSQARSLVERTILQDPDAASKTQQHFFSFSLDHCIGLSQAKSIVQAIRGDTEGALRTQDNFTKGCAVISQARSLVEGTILRNPEAAAKTQEYFFGQQPQKDEVDCPNPALECVVCLTGTKTVLLLPCKHLCLCQKCSAMVTAECPLCKTKIESKTDVYL